MYVYIYIYAYTGVPNKSLSPSVKEHTIGSDPISADHTCPFPRQGQAACGCLMMLSVIIYLHSLFHVCVFVCTLVERHVCYVAT